MRGLEQDFTGRVEAELVDATTPEAHRAVRELGFESHGLVIRTTDGEVLWTQPDHRVDPEDVRMAIAELLEVEPIDLLEGDREDAGS